MLGLVLIYFLGKTFFNLAARFDKNKWGYAILGVLTYYGSTIVGALVLLALFEFMELTQVFNESEIDLMSIPFGLYGCWLFFGYLKKQWENKNEDWKEDVLDGDFFEE